MRPILEVTLYCPTCRVDEVFVPIDCGDGHGDECPERACLMCGEGLVLGSDLPAVAVFVSAVA